PFNLHLVKDSIISTCLRDNFPGKKAADTQIHADVSTPLVVQTDRWRVRHKMAGYVRCARQRTQTTNIDSVIFLEAPEKIPIQSQCQPGCQTPTDLRLEVVKILWGIDRSLFKICQILEQWIERLKSAITRIA